MHKKEIPNKYRPDIDGLRAVAVLSVIIFHYFPTLLPGGFVGVDVFFVISGFLISGILFQSFDQGTFSILEFYNRRIRRIFPSLSVVLISVFIFGWLCLLPDELQQLARHTASSAGFIQNFNLWRESGYFDHANETKPLLHIWSLGVEEQFYFIWPLLLWGIAKIKDKSRFKDHKRIFFLSTIILVFFASFILNLNQIKTDPVKTFYLPHFRFFELALGGILSWVILYGSNFFKLPIDANKWFISNWLKRIEINNVLSFAGLFILIIVFFQFSKETSFPGKNALVPAVATCLIIFAGTGSWLNRKILSNKALVWFGLISYPLYLWHWPILSFGRIFDGEMPRFEFRIIAIVVSIILSWLTVKYIEKPFRFGTSQVGLKIFALCSLIFVIGSFGLFAAKMDFSDTHSFEKLPIKRKGAEFAVGFSFNWFQGKNDWLFLGNAFDSNVEKLIKAKQPSESEIQAIENPLVQLTSIGAKFGTKIALIIGPDKASIYPEFLPDEFVPSHKKRISYFLERLSRIPNLTIYNPTNDLLKLKETEGILYWRTDTHWNHKGAFLVFEGFAQLFGLPIPQVSFKHNKTFSGDLIGISKLQDFPTHIDDNWEVVWQNIPNWNETEIPNEPDSPFAKPSIVTNQQSITNKRIWVVGDSFTNGLKQYINATFQEIRYVGHWSRKLKNLSNELKSVNSKPDMIILVIVERSF
jgi:peptidoglycan/LPS O-acetylase OafA/YrhL